MTLPALTTARLTLEPFTLADVDAMHRLWTDPDVRRYLWDDIIIPRTQAEEVVRQYVETAESGGVGMWRVVDTQSGELAGFCGFALRPPEPAPELMYGLAPRFWGQGLATEAARAAMVYAFDALSCDSITAATDPPNAASVRVMERLGLRFVRRGVLNGLDTLFYAIDRKNFTARPSLRTALRSEPQT